MTAATLARLGGAVALVLCLMVAQSQSTVAATTTTTTTTTSRTAASSPTRPNIVFILTDDLDTVSYDPARFPELQQLMTSVGLTFSPGSVRYRAGFK